MPGTDVAVNHKFVSAKADGPDPTLVRASGWNADHNFTAGLDGLGLIRDSSQADGASWIRPDTDNLTNNTGAGLVVGNVVAINGAADASVVLSDVQGSLLPFVVCLSATVGNTATGIFARQGNLTGVTAQGAITAGHFIRKSATTLAVEDTGVAAGSAIAAPAGSVGIATAAASGGLVDCWWFGYTVSVFSPPVVPKGQCRLTVSGANLLLSPFQGNLLTINSVDQPVPDAGITLAIGAAVANTFYYIYAFMNAGTMTLEFSATGHSEQAGTGIQIKTGDATRTLVGMAFTTAAPAWSDTATFRGCASFFNRRAIGGVSSFSANRTTVSASFAELNTEIRVVFLTWADEAVLGALSGAVLANASTSAVALAFDGISAELPGFVTPATNATPFGISLMKTALAEGNHFATLVALNTGGNTTTVAGSATTGETTALTIGTRG